MPVFTINYEVDMYTSIIANTSEEAKQEIEKVEKLNWRRGTVRNIEVHNITTEDKK